MEEYNWRWCFLCRRKYSCDVFSADQESSDNKSHLIRIVPVKSAVCNHLLCLACVEQQSQDQSSNNNDYLGNQHQSVLCPVCRKTDAFCAYEPIISLVTCQLLKKEAQRATEVPQLIRKPENFMETLSKDESKINNIFSIEKAGDRESLEHGGSKSNNELKYKPDIYVFKEEPTLSTKLKQHSPSPDNP